VYFIVSKIVWFFVQPSALLLIALTVGATLLLFGGINWGRRLVWLAVIGLLVCGFSPLANILLLPLENRFARPAQISGPEYAGIIVLGGSVTADVASERGLHALNESGERITETIALSRRFPEWPIVATGGSIRILEAEGTSEAVSSVTLLREVLGPQRDLRVEPEARNTRENAVFTAGMLTHGIAAARHDPSPWFLVPSAFPMPRAMGCLRKAGVNVRAWPVDYRTRGAADLWRAFAVPSNGLRRMDMVAKEWVGLFVYRLLGYTKSLFPKS